MTSANATPSRSMAFLSEMRPSGWELTLRHDLVYPGFFERADAEEEVPAVVVLVAEVGAESAISAPCIRAP